MPVTIKQEPNFAPPSIAETPEFKELQTQLAQAKSILNAIDNQIIAIEAKMKPNTAKGAYMPSDPSNSVEEAKYQESIAEMQRIAGLR